MYQHTQRSPLSFLLLLPAIGALVAAILLSGHLGPRIILVVVGATFAVLSLTLWSLTITGAPDHLDVRFGPLQVWGTRIFYNDIREAKVAQSSLIDGWGIHYVPYRGWTINLWGFECVKLRLGNRTLRLGTDDAPALAEFVNRMISKTRHDDSGKIAGKTPNDPRR